MEGAPGPFNVFGSTSSQINTVVGEVTASPVNVQVSCGGVVSPPLDAQADVAATRLATDSAGPRRPTTAAAERECAVADRSAERQYELQQHCCCQALDRRSRAEFVMSAVSCAADAAALVLECGRSPMPHRASRCLMPRLSLTARQRHGRKRDRSTRRRAGRPAC